MCYEDYRIIQNKTKKIGRQPTLKNNRCDKIISSLIREMLILH